MSNTPCYFHDLIRSSHGRNVRATLELMRHRICPRCARTTLNTNIDVEPIVAACLACGWTWPTSAGLAMLPQSLLARRKKVMADAEGLRELVRRSYLAGAQVQPGPLHVFHQETEETHLSPATLQQVLGESEFRHLQRRLPRRQRISVLLRSNWEDSLPRHSTETFDGPFIPFLPINFSPAPQSDAEQSSRIEM